MRKFYNVPFTEAYFNLFGQKVSEEMISECICQSEAIIIHGGHVFYPSGGNEETI